MTYIETLKLALALNAWTHFGECRVTDGPIPTPAEVDAALRQAIEQAEQAQPVAFSEEWQPCVKLPVTVHVRAQRPGETHVSTREGITPVKPDDLIMRGVSGEEYPIGREIFEKTYQLGEAPPPRQPLFKDFIQWAGAQGYDCGQTCNSDTGEWICLHPMTADLWKCWQAAHGIKGEA